MNEWVWSNGGMILTGENWSAGRETLYSVGGRWMNEYGGMVLTGENWSTGRETLYSVGGRWMIEYGAMVVWYWQGKTEVLGDKHLLVVLCSWQNRRRLAAWVWTKHPRWEAGVWLPELGHSYCQLHNFRCMYILFFLWLHIYFYFHFRARTQLNVVHSRTSGKHRTWSLV